MKMISMLGLRTHSEEIVDELRSGGDFLLTYRGKKLAKIIPYEQELGPSDSDPFYNICSYSESDENGMTNNDMDALIYGI